MTKHWSDTLPPNACQPAVDWCRTQPDAQTAWDRCRDGSWMLWLLARRNADRRLLVRASALCAEPAAAAAALADERTEAICRATIQTCIAWSEGEATDEELWAAGAAATAARAAAGAASLAYSADIVRVVFPRYPEGG